MWWSDPSWVWPFWLERQSDPSSPDFVPGAAGGPPVDQTHRDGTAIGTLASYPRGLVDPRGLVTPVGEGFSLDWWVGAEDRWHLPGRSTTVRQRLVGNAPVVETAMRVPGGDVLHRAYGIRDTTLGPVAVIEIENRTAVPVALALAVRPYHPLGLARVGSIALADTTVAVDGEPVLLLPRPPGHAVVSVGAEGDCAQALLRGDDPVAGDVSVVDPDGRATAAFVFPLTHTAILRVVLPLTPVAGGARARRGGSGSAPVVLRYPEGVPSAEQVAKGWEAQTRRGLRVELPDARLQAAVDAARCHLLLAHGGEDVATWPPVVPPFAAMAAVIGALDQWGFADEAAQVLATWAERQALDGSFVGASDRVDANGAALAAVAEHWQRTGDGELVELLIGPVAKAIHWIGRARRGRRPRRGPSAPGLLPAGAAPPAGGEPGVYFRDDAVTVAALEAIAPALDAIGQPEVAADARSAAASLRAELDAAMTEAAGSPHVAVPPGPGRRADGGVVVNLDLAAPGGVLALDDARMAATVAAVRATCTEADAVVQRVGPAGLHPALTARLARIELAAGDRRALDRLRWLLDAGGATVAWPEVVHPRTGGGAAGAPHDPVATAGFLSVVRDLLVREVDGGLALCSLVPDTWLGQSLDVRGAPTAAGLLSFSVRWHGERPALLWELEAHPGRPPVRLTAPGLDRSWSTEALSGEALLAPVPPPALAGADGPGDATGHDHGHAHGHDDDGGHGHGDGGDPPAPPAVSGIETPIALRPPAGRARPADGGGLPSRPDTGGAGDAPGGGAGGSFS